MSETPQPTLVVGMLGIVGVILTGIISYFGGRGQAQAAMQTAFNGMADILLKGVQLERDHCEEKLATLDAKYVQLEQFNRSLVHQLQSRGIDITHSVPEPFIVLEATVEKSS